MTEHSEELKQEAVWTAPTSGLPRERVGADMGIGKSTGGVGQEAEAAALLAAIGIAMAVVRHPPAFTAEDGRAYRHLMPGAHTKTLFLKSKKDEFVLAVVDADGVLDVQGLARWLGVGRLSFCSSDRLMTWTGLTPGSVTPLALGRAAVHPECQRLTVAADLALAQAQQFWVHPLHNAASIALTGIQLDALATHLGFTVRWFDAAALR